jgi:hypothetical protein
MKTRNSSVSLIPPLSLSLFLSFSLSYREKVNRTTKMIFFPSFGFISLLSFSAIPFASRQLKDHEKNYSPFLLETAAVIWGMDVQGKH